MLIIMKRYLFVTSCLLFVLLISSISLAATPEHTGQTGQPIDIHGQRRYHGEGVVLEALNPRGVIDPPPNMPLSPRVSDLDGKTIGLYDNGKEGFTAFLDVIEELINKYYPTTTVKRYVGAFDIGDQMAAQIAKEVDTIIYGVGD